MRVMKNKTLFESFQENLKEATVDENWCAEQAEYYFNQDCQDNGNLDEIDYVDILNDYTDNEDESKKVESLIHDAWKKIKDHIYNFEHKKYIELSDNRTLWNIENDKFPSDDYKADEYQMQVDFAVEDFEAETGVELYGLGRSGRHICVELNYQNALAYDELVSVQKGLEQRVIDAMNSWEPENESNINEDVKDLEPSYSNKKSFYGKAKVDDDGQVHKLVSYETPIMTVKDGEITMLCKPEHLTQTTLRHIKEFLQQMGLEPLSKKELIDLINKQNEGLNEQDSTIRVVTSQQEDRDYSITDITELNKVSDGDVQAPIDISGLLVEVDSRLTESYGEKWGQINFQSTRYNAETKDSNALFELNVGDKTYLMSMLLEENGSLLKVNNTKGQTIFKRKSSNITSLAESYIKQFIPKEEKEVPEVIKHINEDLHDAFDFLKSQVELSKKVPKDEKEAFNNYLQTQIYAFVAEVSNEVKPSEPTDEDKLELPSFDKMVEELFGKDWVKEVKEPETKEVEGTEALKESTKTEKEYRIIDTKTNKVLKTFKADEEEKGYNEMRKMGEELKKNGKDDNLIYKEFTVKLKEADEPEVNVENPAEELDDKPEEEPVNGLGTGYATFVRKPSNIDDLNNKAKYFTDGEASYLICDKQKLSKDEFDKIQNDFLTDNKYCKEFEPKDLDNYSYNVIEFSCDDYDYKLLVDPSGHGYCRYVAIVGGNK